MTANGKVRITISASYTDGEFFSLQDLNQARVVIADALVRAIEHSELSLLEVRIIVPARHAEELVIAMVRGEAEIGVGKLSPVFEPD